MKRAIILLQVSYLLVFTSLTLLNIEPLWNILISTSLFVGASLLQLAFLAGAKLLPVILKITNAVGILFSIYYLAARFFNLPHVYMAVVSQPIIIMLLVCLAVKLMSGIMNWPYANEILLICFLSLVAFYVALAVQAYMFKLDSWDKYLGLASGAALLINILPVFKIFSLWWDNVFGNG